MNSPDHTATLPWHMQQVVALTDDQRADLLLSFYATWQANEEVLATMHLTPATLLSPREQAAIHCKATLQTVLRASNLPIPTYP